MIASPIPVAPFEIDAPVDLPLPTADNDEKDIVAMVRDQIAPAEFFHTSDGSAYVSLENKGRNVTLPVVSRQFKQLILARFYKSFGGAISGRKLDDVIAQLEAEAVFDGPCIEVHRRVAAYDGAIVLDLSDGTGRVVLITSIGWEVRELPEVKFAYDPRTRALPEPERGGSVSELRPFVNVASSDSFHLLLGFIVTCLRPRGPYPVLLVDGPQGSAKSTLTRVVKRLVDPTRPEVRRMSAKPEDLMIAARHSHVVTFDNLSGLSPQLSDSLCTIATGGGFATRRFHTNTEEVYYEVCNPLILNGIDGLADRGDLADRGIHLELASIRRQDRRDEESFWSEFEQVLPRILGALCDAVSTALRRFPTVRLDSMPRLADVARWVSAAEPALGIPEGAFLAAFERNRAESLASTAQADTVALEVATFAKQLGAGHPAFVTASQLLQRLNGANPDRPYDRSWPKTPQALSARLRRASDALRELDVDVDFDRIGHAGERQIRVVWHPPTLRAKAGKDNVVPLRPMQQPANEEANSASIGESTDEAPGAS